MQDGQPINRLQRFALNICSVLVAAMNVPAFAQTSQNAMQSAEEQRVLAE